MNTLVVVLLCTQVFAGGERENQLRYLQTLGLAPLYPWGVRAFSARETDGLTAGRPDGQSGDRPTVRPSDRQWLPIAVSVRYNSTFPYGFNDQAIWAGKGVTLAAEAGFSWRRGVVSLTIAPLVFVAQNAAFTLMPNGSDTSGANPYGDGSMGQIIDRPQRFGDKTYARLDPGQSTLRVDWLALTAGVTTANQYWGPATDFPFILGNNAAGFPHLFLGTARPIDLKLFRLHGRVLWGKLGESAFAPESSTAVNGRLASGVILDLTFGWLRGLEIGATRFAHAPWRAGGPTLDDLFNIFQASESGLISSNQLASVFFRWVLPKSGFEVYGEYGKDDYNSNGRAFLLEPDRYGGYMIGFRKAMRRPNDRVLAVRAELQNLQISSLAQGGAYVPFYTHIDVRQGHTQLGQVLGSEAGPGGAGSVVAVESFSPRGSWTWAWTRMIRQQRGDQTGATTDPNGVDVQHALWVERVQPHGRYDLLTRITGVYELNRNYSYDAFNLNLIVGLSFR
jgi:hypothetical protein